MIDPGSARALFELVIELGPRLREAGAAEIDLDGFVVRLAPAQMQASAPAPSSAPRNTFEDPEAYGLPPGADVPGLEWFEHLRRKPDELAGKKG